MQKNGMTNHHDPAPTEPVAYLLTTDAAFAVADAWVTRRTARRSRSRRPQTPGELVFLSISAAQHAIKTVRPKLRGGSLRFANLQALSDAAAEPEPDGAVNPNGLKNGSFYETRLPKIPDSPITSHLIAVAPDPPPVTGKAGSDAPIAHTGYIFAKSDDQAAKSYYRHFAAHSRIPTIPEWADGLWALALAHGLAVALPSSPNIYAWECEINDSRLTPIITDAVRCGLLPIP